MNTNQPGNPSPETTPKPLPRWKVAMFWAGLLVLMGGCAEFAAGRVLRAAYGYDGTHLLQYQFDSYKNILPTPDYRDTRGVTHNHAGFRRRGEVAVEKPAGTVRIFLMGASAAFGTGGLWPHIEPRYPVLADSVTIDAYLERQIREARPDLKVEVINAAIPSTWTHHSFIYLSQTVLRYRPDIVLFFDGFNDFYQCEAGHDQFVSYTYGERATTIMGPPTVGALIQANGWWMSRKSAAAYLAFRSLQQVGQLINRPGERPPIPVDECFAGFQRNFPANALSMWRRSAVLLRSEGIDGLFMLQPMLMLERDRPGLTEMEKRLLEFDVTSWPTGREPYIRRAAPWAADTARRTIEGVGQQFLDMTGVFRDVTFQAFTDYAHLTPPANALVARRMLPQLLPLITARYPAPAGR